MAESVASPTAAGMICRAGLQSLFAHYDWANDLLLRASAGLGDAALDRAFEMGLGTLRQTLAHTLTAEKAWLGRCGVDVTGVDLQWDAPHAVAHLQAQAQRLRDVRSPWLAGLAEAQIARLVEHTGKDGQRFGVPLGEILMHVVSHATYHRAQAVNMLRHLGQAPPKTDVIIMSRLAHGPLA